MQALAESARLNKHPGVHDRPDSTSKRAANFKKKRWIIYSNTFARIADAAHLLNVAAKNHSVRRAGSSNKAKIFIAHTTRTTDYQIQAKCCAQTAEEEDYVDDVLRNESI
ncbi:MAG: hypothetical protein LR015_06850 [Verrucomicrobia bacterium]|nr:hypothetical protein [Verrucomicrobiota bacterium]